MADESVDLIADELVAGAKARFLGAAHAQVTEQQANAIAQLLASLQGSSDALLTFSNMLIAKVNNVPVVRELSPAQRDFLMQNPSLSSTPGRALAALDKVEQAPLQGIVTLAEASLPPHPINP
ncbi:hypothetical protein [Nonomuraea guangzhouensis]|uniref:Uncharacterized protein n=1 Tax=Nonomuraea guangzhouensis TaxID=1291555 RepID=A0ABW4FYN5_9ACTN|nr:hypothetical protein [Nonomuraea guangzhouensis]